MIVTADWHLVDSPDEEYRWGVFDSLRAFCKQENDYRVFILGDLCDRKDRHSAVLVNRLVNELRSLLDEGFKLKILMGNHDIALNGTPYWQILNMMQPGLFVHKPRYAHAAGGGLLLLPFSAKPDEDWAEYTNERWAGATCIFMHQPVDGALTENGRRYETTHQLPLPDGIPIFSGDIHTPQRVGKVRYVGAPHVIDFGDMYQCRMLRISGKSFQVVRTQIDEKPFRKWMLRGSSVEQMKGQFFVKKGDKAKIEFTLPIEKVDTWGAVQIDLRVWADDIGFTIVSMEAIIETEVKEIFGLDMGVFVGSDEDVLRAYAKHAGIKGRVLQLGVDILNEVKNA